MSEYLHVEKPFPRPACGVGLDGHRSGCVIHSVPAQSIRHIRRLFRQ